MASMAPERPDMASTPERIEALVRECEKLQAATGRAQAIRWLLILGFLGFVGTFGYLFWRMAERLRSQEFSDQVVETAKTKLSERSDDYMAEVRTLVDNSSPVVVEAFTKQAREDMPIILKMAQSEGESLIEELKTRVRQVVEAHLQNTLDKYQNEMMAEIPALKDPELRKRLSENLVLAAEKASERYFINELETRVKSIYDTWDRFPIAEKEAQEGTRTEDLLIGELFELAKQSILEEQRINQQ